jgi:predicted transcriptional regulator
MAQPPEEFHNEFEKKGETFREIAELLYTHPDRQYTQDELAEKVGRTNTTISNHTGDMVDAGWLTRQENQTTFTWNSDAHNPATTEGFTATKRFYADFLDLIREHTKTAPGVFAIVGFSFILTAVVLFAFFLGLSLRITQESTIPTVVYFVIAVGSFLSGVIVTFLSPLQAIVNRFLLRIIPESIFNDSGD